MESWDLCVLEIFPGKRAQSVTDLCRKPPPPLATTAYRRGDRFSRTVATIGLSTSVIMPSSRKEMTPVQDHASSYVPITSLLCSSHCHSSERPDEVLVYLRDIQRRSSSGTTGRLECIIFFAVPFPHVSSGQRRVWFLWLSTLAAGKRGLTTNVVHVPGNILRAFVPNPL